MSTVYPWRDAPQTAFAVIGDPIAHSLSPQMQTAALRALGREETYLALHVLPGEVAEALSHLKTQGTLGINVTVPHKADALAWATHADPTSAHLAAANTLNLKTGEARNTDAPGFLASLPQLTPAKALILGAGGSARAVAFALHQAGWQLELFNRTRERAQDLLQELNLPGKLQNVPSLFGFQLIVNTTSASLSGESVPLPWAEASPAALAYDLTYAPEPTAFCQAAAKAGLATQDGREMLVQQGALAMEWWLGQPAPREIMRAAIAP